MILFALLLPLTASAVGWWIGGSGGGSGGGVTYTRVSDGGSFDSGAEVCAEKGLTCIANSVVSYGTTSAFAGDVHACTGDAVTSGETFTVGCN